MINLNIGVNDINQLIELKKFGINKVFCGYLEQEIIDAWKNEFSLLNRRGSNASIVGKINFQKFINVAENLNISVFVTFNGTYIFEQYNWILQAIKYVSSFKGVKGIIVGDIGLLLRLKELNYEKDIVISTLGTTFNSATVQFYKQFNVSRIVLDKQTKVDEIINILESNKDMNFEIFLLFINCMFIDGYCSLFHQLYSSNNHDKVGCGYINMLRVNKKYEIIKQHEYSKIYNINPSKNSYSNTGCNLCIVRKLKKYSKQITYKLVTRGNNEDEFNRAKKYLQIIQNLDTNNFDEKELFKCIFNQKCDEYGCYISHKIV